MSFMSQLGQLEVKIEQEGIKLIHAAGDWVDHLSWNQVQHLLAPAIREVAPNVLDDGDKAPAPEPIADVDQVALDDIPAAVVRQLDAWFQGAADKLRAEFGEGLAAAHRRIDQLVSDSGGAQAVTTTEGAPAAPAPAKKAAPPRKKTAPPAAAQ